MIAALGVIAGFAIAIVGIAGAIWAGLGFLECVRLQRRRGIVLRFTRRSS